MRYLAWFNEVPDEELAVVAGGKGASLCRMSRSDLPVPEGFIVSSEIFNLFMKESDLWEKVFDLIKGIDWECCSSLVKIAEQIRAMIIETPMPSKIEDMIGDYYSRLGIDAPVAVRSSGTAEDLDSASFAGQQETFLFVIGEKNVIKYIKECWASLYNDRAIFYRREKGFDEREISIAVVIQSMVNSAKSGVMFSANPIDGNRDVVVIEAAWGLCEAVVSGIVTPDDYWIDSRTYEVIREHIAEKEVMIVRLGEAGGTKEIPVPEEIANAPVLSEEELRLLVDTAKNVEKFYGKPQDLEWGIDHNGKLYLLQSRPITTLK